MKKLNLFRILLLVVPILSLVSCDKDDDIKWDINPVNARIVILNEEGQNLLVPEVEGSLYLSDIKAEYKGKTYSASWSASNNIKDQIDEFRGLYYFDSYSFADDEVNRDPESDCLKFGAFDGDEFQDIEFELSIPKVSEKYTIRLIHRFGWVNQEPKHETVVYLNGVLQPAETAYIVIPNEEPTPEE